MSNPQAREAVCSIGPGQDAFWGFLRGDMETKYKQLLNSLDNLMISINSEKNLNPRTLLQLKKLTKSRNSFKKDLMLIQEKPKIEHVFTRFLDLVADNTLHRRGKV